MIDKQKIERQLQELKDEFASGLDGRIEEIKSLLHQLLQTPESEATLTELHLKVHSLTGSAATFGFNDLTGEIRNLENELYRYIKESLTPDANTVHTLIDQAEALQQHAANLIEQQNYSSKKSFVPHILTATKRLIYVVEDDSIQGKEIILKLEYYGFQARLFSNATDAWQALEHERPDALVLDIVLPEGDLSGTYFASSVRDIMNGITPYLFISSRTDWSARIAAVRSGGSAYIEKPIDYSLLIEQLIRLTNGEQPDPFRVLVVDNHELSNYYVLPLKKVGMNAMSLDSPSKILDVLDEFQPELIVMELNFPDVSGIEIAQLLRQHPHYLYIPIIIISAKIDTEDQVQILREGMDFLEKPIIDYQLVNSIHSRIEHVRRLSRLFYTERRTGLLHQSALERQLLIELGRAQRHLKQTSFALLYIDSVKEMIKEPGVGICDRMNKALCDVLTTRLRVTDYIGRYSSGEIGIIMPDTKAEEGKQILNEIQDLLNIYPFEYEGVSHRLSFSAGIASSDKVRQERELLDRVYIALDTVKREGGERVVIVDNETL